MNYQFLNLGCGDALIDNDRWLNLDYAPIIPTVKKANLLARLPCKDNSFQVVYSSHFLEHIPYQKVQGFLGECYRVLEKNGAIRLVLPDLEDICREYLKCREQGEHEKADFSIIEMLDQCVRMESESYGQLGRYFQYLQQNKTEAGEMIEYVKCRTGADLLAPVKKKDEFSSNFFVKTIQQILATAQKNHGLNSNFFTEVTQKGLRKLEYRRIQLLTSLLPTAFREQNVSYVDIGDKHCWMWDFYSLANQLRSAGFKEIKKVSFDSSGIPDFPLIPLDMNPDGTPRKGHSSMYIEACK